VFIHKGLKFFFFSNEGSPREPIHIHVRKDRMLAKFWLYPQVQLAESYGFSAKELNNIASIVYNKRNEIEDSWNEHFKS
jgi:Domain of unknown function (DUF4160)